MACAMRFRWPRFLSYIRLSFSDHNNFPAGEIPGPLNIRVARKCSSSSPLLLLQRRHEGTVTRFDGRGFGKKHFGGTWSRVRSEIAPQKMHGWLTFTMCGGKHPNYDPTHLGVLTNLL